MKKAKEVRYMGVVISKLSNGKWTYNGKEKSLKECKKEILSEGGGPWFELFNVK